MLTFLRDMDYVEDDARMHGVVLGNELFGDCRCGMPEKRRKSFGTTAVYYLDVDFDWVVSGPKKRRRSRDEPRDSDYYEDEDYDDEDYDEDYYDVDYEDDEYDEDDYDDESHTH